MAHNSSCECDPVHAASLPDSVHVNPVRPRSHGSPSTTADRLPSFAISPLVPLTGNASSQVMSHPPNAMSAIHHEPITSVESFAFEEPVHPTQPINPAEQSSFRPLPRPSSPRPQSSLRHTSSPTLSHAPSPSPSPSLPALVDEPLSTVTLPIPDAPATAEADAAFQQVLDTIEAADHRGTFSDSGYSESVTQSSSTSLSSSVRNFEFENGRRYHAFRQGQYLLPNDDLEQEREDMKHATVLAVCGERLHFAPLNEDQPQQMRVLDLGTGTGIWCCDMGDKYPSAEIIGVDLSPHQPDWVPPNVRFIVDDIESEWLQPDNHFDMIHLRHMAIAIKDWDHVLASAWHALKPGGWIEFHELDYFPRSDDGTQTPENQHLLWTTLVSAGLRTFNVDLHGAHPLKDRVVGAGYQNITEHIIKVPIGQWPKNQLLKKVGMYMHAVLWDGLQGVAMGPLTRGLGWSKEQVELLLPGVRKDLNDLSIHTYYSLHIVIGQKV